MDPQHDQTGSFLEDPAILPTGTVSRSDGRATLTTGSRVGRYEILSLLGAGGMGEVYRARDPQIVREGAIKVLPSPLTGDPDRVRRFEQEARAAGALNHPNI